MSGTVTSPSRRVTQWKRVERKIGLVLVTHGRLAAEFVTAMEHVVGPQEAIEAICIGADDDMERRRRDILDAAAAVDTGRGVIVLTDMFGGTPTNIASMFFVEGEVEVVTGVNLPMVIKLASQGDTEPLAVVAGRVRDQGQQAIHLAGELLAAPKKK